jgi:hypothetical protein
MRNIASPAPDVILKKQIIAYECDDFRLSKRENKLRRC